MTDPEAWEVIRIDDNGVEHILAKNLQKQEAQLLELKFTKRGHKQLYLARLQTNRD